ncbi:MAG: 4Fe-4S binding protein [Gammaproteobacteria bacterium]|nr:4Fe-4S binding protein [Gammaproteobacteria bacterium]MBI5616920.1 4Fe-4S binding protein [Gammaproteobacteria bacterium]
MNLADHPTVRELAAGAQASTATTPFDPEWLKAFCLEAGADDAGCVSIEHPDLADQRAAILKFFPATKTLVSLVARMNREPIRNPARSVANLEFHHTGHRVDEVARHLVAVLEARGIRAINPPMAFPMEMDAPDGRAWIVSHKPVAVAAGLGRMGIHRNVIHPQFGNFILLGTVLVGAEVTAYAKPIDYNPCLECKLCVAACPVGAIGPDGHFDFSACYTHNYRDFMGGFGDWVERIADSRDARDYRRRVSAPETASMWQSLAYGPNYKAANCLAVCPAGADVIGPFLDDRRAYLDAVVRPLQDAKEVVYVVPGSDAEDYVQRRFPHKRPRRVGNGLARVGSVRRFLHGLPLVFQRGRAKGLALTLHFRFTGAEQLEGTVEIRDQKLAVREGLHGEPDLAVTADSRTWLGFTAKERGLVGALLSRRIRLRGSPKHLLAFGRCFPS